MQSNAGINTIHLLVILIRLIIDNVEEPQLIDTLGRRHDTEPVTELLLLEELLCAIITVSNAPCHPSRVCRHTGTSSSGLRTLGAQ
jgi:hypothetical protein